MGENAQNGEKSHQPTEKRLASARNEGDIPKSPEVTQAAIYASLLLLCAGPGKDLIFALAGSLAGFIGHADTRLADIDGIGRSLYKNSPLQAVLVPASLLLLVPFFAAIVALAAQRTFVFVPTKLLPKIDRIAPTTALKNRFGRLGLFEFAKSLTKLCLVSVLAAMLIYRKFDQISGIFNGYPSQFPQLLQEVLLSLLTGILILTTSIGLIDLFWQRHAHTSRLQMSLEELRREAKESEGDPHIKSQRQRRAVEIATNRMMLDVPKAEVVIVNPTHYAVALSWDRAKKSAPVCVAKGTDAIAARIREAASVAGVPIHRDAASARSLHATVAIGQEIQPSHYRAVAAAIRFSEKMRQAAATRGPR